MAYARAVKQFFDWCDERRLQLADIEGHQRRYLHRTAWHPGQQADRQAASGRHLPAVRLSHHRRDSGRQPCRFGTGPRYVVKRGKTAVLSSEETRKLLDSIESNTLIGLRDQLIGTMVYSFARVGATVTMKVGDYFQHRKRWWLRLHRA